MDLIGIPLRITIGKKINDNLVEYKKRTNSQAEDVNIEEIVNKVVEYVKGNLK